MGIKSRKIHIYANFLTAALTTIICLILINNLINKAEETITSDGIGYYDYLPSLFIHKDFDRKNYPISKFPELYKRFDNPYVYVNYKDYRIDKYPVGTAILQSPFFLTTYLFSTDKGNLSGYESQFQEAIYIAAIFYLFLTLIFFGRTLKLYNVKWQIISFLQLLLPLATNILHYINVEASFSHVYSLFAISGFVYFVRLYFKKLNLKHLIYASIFLGLIILIRQINVLVLLCIPFLSGNSKALIVGFKAYISNFKGILVTIGIPTILFIPQLITWYLQTGDLFVYSYQGEGFNFMKPEIFNILFSYEKGLFVYTPIIFLSFICLIFYAYKRNWFSLFSWLLFFGGLTYVLSSWWSWSYGCSYGLRAYIEFFPILLIPLAVFLNYINFTALVISSIPLMLAVPINVIQTYQYKTYILHWIDMDKKKYWDVFLEHEDQFKGYVWKTTKEVINLDTLYHISIDDVAVSGNSKIVLNQSLSIDNITTIPKLIETRFKNNFERKNSSIFYVNLIHDSKVIYSDKRPLLHFSDSINYLHTGKFQNWLSLKEENFDSLNLIVEIDPNGYETELENFSLTILGNQYNHSRIEEIILNIKSDSTWLNKVEQQSIENDITLNEALKQNAIWVINNSN